MLSKRHAAVWRAFAIHLNVVHRSIQTFDKTIANDKYALRFLHVVLPNLGKDLDRGLKTGIFVKTAPVARQRNSVLPRFLYELFSKVFDDNGYIHLQPSGIKDLRQLLYLFYKFEVPFDKEDIAKASLAFVERDLSVKTDKFPFGLAEVRKNFCSLLPDDPLDIRPRHSNGASSVKVTNSEKLSKRTHYPDLFGIFGPQYFFNSLLHAQDWASSNLTVTTKPYSKVTFVPKDSRGPRTICMEPHEYMFIQQGLMHVLYDYVEKYSPAKGYINFTDQTINQSLAYKSSIDNSLSTIDLKDASDMVPMELVKLLAPPHWWRALNACRTPEAICNGDIVPLKKFAPMGSALCFPIEAMIFYSICKTVAPQVWVYGDDIIVEREYAQQCVEALESYGLIVNHDKTLISGPFKESCGSEFYNGHDITYVKCKSYDYLEAVAFCNEITEHFGLELSSKVLAVIEHDSKIIYYREPFENRSTPEPGVFYTDNVSASYVFFSRRWNKHLQRYEVRRLRPSNRGKINEDVSGYDRLFSWLTMCESTVQPELDSRLARINSGIDGGLKRFPFYLGGTYHGVSPRYDLPLDRNIAVYRDASPGLKYAWDGVNSPDL